MAEVAAKGVSADYEEDEDEPEDIAKEFRYIESLPRRTIRGLQLPADDRGYFIAWPGGVYYKYRFHDAKGGSKYLGPRGHKPPLFWVRKKGQKTLVIVEGEINGLSLGQAFPEYDICSPGSASMFNSQNLSKHLTEFLKYDNILVVLDDDAAGIKGLIETKAFFLYKHPFVSFIRMSPDCNDVLSEQGPEFLRKKLQGQNIK